MVCAELCKDLEEQLGQAQQELDTRAYESVQLSGRLADANEHIGALAREKSLLKAECAKLSEQNAVFCSPNATSRAESGISLAEKTRNLELQTKLSQAEFDAQILKIRCGNLESEANALRQDLAFFKQERRPFIEGSALGESRLPDDSAQKAERLAQTLTGSATLKSELEPLSASSSNKNGKSSF